MKGNCILSDVFSASIEIFMFLSFIFKWDVPHLLFLNVEPSLHIKYESHLVWISGLFCKSLMVLFHSKCLICLICLLFERERARERERKREKEHMRVWYPPLVHFPDAGADHRWEARTQCGSPMIAQVLEPSHDAT